MPTNSKPNPSSRMSTTIPTPAMLTPMRRSSMPPSVTSSMLAASASLAHPHWMLLLVVLLTNGGSPAGANVETRLEDEIPQRFCGSRLNSELALVCNGSFASPMPLTAKPANEKAINDQPLDSNSPYVYRSSVHRAAQVAATKNTRLRREEVHWYVQRGIVEECCDSPCTRNTLRSYCRPTSMDE